VRILVVEDDAATIELLNEALESDGHDVVAEPNGIAGRERALTETFDLILCDIGLPGLDGLSLAREIRSKGLAVPLFALTGRAGDDERRAGLAAGFDSYLTKPITPSALLRELALQEARRPVPNVATSAAERGGEARTSVGLRVGQLSRAPVAASVEAGAPEASGAARPRPRGVLGGAVVIAMGLPFVLQPLGIPNAASYLFLAMGVAFLVSYLRGRRYVYLIPMVTLSSFGVALLLPTWIVMRPETIAPAFVGIIALGFVAAFALSPSRRWPLVPAGLLGIVAAARLVTGFSPIPTPLEPFLVPVVLVGVGVYLLVERQD
jgi:CheY-like chemotaxis protein